MKKTHRRKIALLLMCAVLAATTFLNAAQAKTSFLPEQQVGTVLFYVVNSAGEEILVSQTDVAQMNANLPTNAEVHNYSILDSMVTTVHQESQGFSLADFIDYAQGKSTVSALRNLPLTWNGTDTLAMWTLDMTTYGDLNTFTHDYLDGTPRYNFPLLYKYWNYGTQDYYDPDGVMTRDEVIDYILENGEPASALLGVRNFSQRYILTTDKFNIQDYDMENTWVSRDTDLSPTGWLDNERALRIFIPMSEAELRNKTATANNSRHHTFAVKLDMAQRPVIASLGSVPAPTGYLTEDNDNYYVHFNCADSGAAIYYNGYYSITTDMPSVRYTEPIRVPKSAVPTGKFTINAHAVRDGCTDAGTVQLTLKTSDAPRTQVYTTPTHGAAGGSVMIPVMIQGNPGFAGFSFEFSYDTDNLTLTGIAKGDILRDFDEGMFTGNVAGNRVVFSSAADLTQESGEILRLTFTVKPDATEHMFSVLLSLADGYNENFANAAGQNIYVDFSDTGPSVLTPEYIRGDVNGDEEVDMADVAMLSRYVAKLTELTDAQQLAADVDDSGEVDMADVAMLSRYVAKLVTW
ncbi:MAG: dockerin type I domain-containing protein [Oscillospiraceae bacterium]|jgi:hypothetical protein|nr:dockerin type I domain-containing protein [Oscillospiraceae bacterium]